MARNRTKDEILDQLVYAIACVAYHYGPGLSAEGLLDIRKKLAEGDWWCDSSWRVDVMEKDYYGDELQIGYNADEPDPDFCPSIISPDLLYNTFAEIVKMSRTSEREW